MPAQDTDNLLSSLGPLHFLSSSYKDIPGVYIKTSDCSSWSSFTCGRSPSPSPPVTTTTRSPAPPPPLHLSPLRPVAPPLLPLICPNKPAVWRMMSPTWLPRRWSLYCGKDRVDHQDLLQFSLVPEVTSRYSWLLLWGRHRTPCHDLVRMDLMLRRRLIFQITNITMCQKLGANFIWN